MSKQIQQQRAYNFFVRTYLDEVQMRDIIEQHQGELKAWAYMLHDKDVFEEKDNKEKAGQPKEKHFHLVIACRSQHTVSGIQRWFKARDQDGKDINTHVEITADKEGSYQYLWHKNDPEKAQYNKEKVVGWNKEFFEENAGNGEDNVYMALQDILNGVPCRELARRYGRDVILHYGAIKSFAYAIQEEERITRQKFEKAHDLFDEREDAKK